MKNYSLIKRSSTIVAVLLLSGCAATQTMISKRDLDVQTKMSDTIFLDPLPTKKHVVFVQITNTSDKPDFDIKKNIVSSIEQKGYQVTDDPDKAYIMLQANILSVGEKDLREARNALDQGYGGALSGAVVGGAAGSMFDSDNSTLAGGLVGGLIGMAADAMVKDTNYSTIVDVRIGERSKVPVIENTRAHLKQGNSGYTKQTLDETSDWKKSQTRILANAEKVNLKFEEASPLLVAGITRSISGMFGA